MTRFIELTAESVRMLSFLTVVGLATMAVAPLSGCDKPPATPVEETTVLDAPVKKDIQINAPGVNIDIDRTPGVDGKRDVDVIVDPGLAPRIDVDVDRAPGVGPAVDVDVDRK